MAAAMGIWSRNQSMGWAALVLGASILLSRFMGLIRDKIVSYFFGASLESDLYFAAFVVPDFINYLLAGGYFSITLIPLLARYFETDEEDGWRFFSTVLAWLTLAVTPITAAAMIFAPFLARLAAPGLDPPQWERLALFLRIILPAQICFLTGSCFTALLYLRRQFAVPALTPLVYNLFIIAGGVWLKDRGMEGFCWGVLGGALAGNLLLPAVAAWKGGGVRLRLSFAHPGLGAFVLLALPLMVGQSVVVLDEQLVRVFGSLAETGAVSWLNYARRIMLVPVGVVAQAAGVASYPFLAALAARGDFSAFHETLRTALRNTVILLVPLSAWMAVAAEPAVRIIFQQGHFDAQDALRTAGLLRILSTVVFCWGIQQVLSRGFYALRDTVTPAIVGTLATLAAVPVFWILGRRWGATGVAWASVSGMAFYTLALSAVWCGRVGSEAFRGMGKVLAAGGVFAVAACLPAYGCARWLGGLAGGHPYTGALLALGGSGTVFVLTFSGLSLLWAPFLTEPLREKGRALSLRLSRKR